jgi:hypothetical protein
VRRHDLDWLWAIAILLLLFVHSAMPYVAEWDWNLKNAETSPLLMEASFFLRGCCQTSRRHFVILRERHTELYDT